MYLEPRPAFDMHASAFAHNHKLTNNNQRSINNYVVHAYIDVRASIDNCVCVCVCVGVCVFVRV